MKAIVRYPKVAGIILIAGSMLSGILPAQEPRTPAERDPVPPGEMPGGAPMPRRVRPFRMQPGENQPMPMPEQMPSRAPAQMMRPPTEIAPARFETTVYEVQVPEARIAEFEAPALEAKAGTPQELAKALGEFGKTKVLYKIDQTVNLFGENITLGSREPIVTNTRQTDFGVVNSFTYQEVGLIVNLAANPPGPDGPRKDLNVQVNFELSALGDSEVEISPPAKATRIRNLRLNHSETPRFGKPLVLLNVSASPGSEKTLPVAYVVRYVFREVKP